MIDDTIKMRLITLATYTKKTNHAISSISMTFKKGAIRPKLEAQIDNQNQRTELSDTLIEPISFKFQKELEFVNEVYDNFKPEQVKVSAGIDELGIKGKTLKISIRFLVPKDQSLRSCFRTVCGKIPLLEAKAGFICSAETADFYIKDGQFKYFDIVFGNDIPSETFKEQYFSKRFFDKVEELQNSAKPYLAQYEPSIKCTFSLMQRSNFQFLFSNIRMKQKVEFQKGFLAEDIALLLSHINQAVDLFKEARLGNVVFKETKPYLFESSFELYLAQTPIEIQPKIPLTLEKTDNFRNLLDKAVFDNIIVQPFQGWRNCIALKLDMDTEHSAIKLVKHTLAKSFSHEGLARAIDNIQYVQDSLDKSYKIKQLGFTTKKEKAVGAILEVTNAQESDDTSEGLDLNSNDYPIHNDATITRYLANSNNAYILKKEKVVLDE